MQVYEERGIRIAGEGAELCIDSGGSGSGVITHAHLDHCAMGNGFTHIMSPETAALIEARNGGTVDATKIGFGKKFRISDFDVSMRNSGHILGSAQVLVEGSKTVAVTSDFKLQSSLLMEPAEVLHADILVMETTFGSPAFRFPERRAVYEDMERWMKERLAENNFVLLAGYAVGKAQEITAVANEFLGIAPLVHDSVHSANRVYEKHGAKLGDYIKLNHNLGESNVLIMPPSLVNAHLIQALSYSLGRPVVAASFTGWGRRGCFSKNFPMSDHADFEQLMRYVKESEPSVLLTTHGFATEFANFAGRRLGVAARALTTSNQRSIMEYAH